MVVGKAVIISRRLLQVLAWSMLREIGLFCSPSPLRDAVNLSRAILSPLLFAYYPLNGRNEASHAREEQEL